MGDSKAKLVLAGCARCGNLFSRERTPVCEHCSEDEEADYRRIRETLHHHPGVSVDAVSELSGVDPSCILRMLDEGVISNESLSNPSRCGQCGDPAISSIQKLCSRCIMRLDRKLAAELSSARATRKGMDESIPGQVHNHLQRKRRQRRN